MNDAPTATATLLEPGSASGVDRENPWPGPTSFTEGQAAFFHGRAREVGEMLRLVRREDLAILFGKSGLGKTSLLQAGLFPALREAGFLPVPLRVAYGAGPLPAEQIRNAMARAFEDGGIEASPPEPAESLWEYFHRRDVEFWNPRHRLVTPILVFDQFEELFTLGRETESARSRSEAFLQELADLAENRLPAELLRRLESGEADGERFAYERPACKIVLSLREDFLPDLEGLRALFRGIVLNRMRLSPMTGARAAEVVVRAGGHLVDGGVAGRIVRFVAAAKEADDSLGSSDAPPPASSGFPRDGGDGLSSPAGAADGLEVEPALLSIVCRELNNRRRERGMSRITDDLLAGTRRGILIDFYELVVRDIPPGARRFIEDRLLTRAGYRDSVALENALHDGPGLAGVEGKGEAPTMSREVLDHLVARRLLRVEERLGSRRVELTHDVLTEPVKGSRDERHQREALAAVEEKARRAAAEARRRRRVLFLVSGLALLGIGALSGLALVAVGKGEEAERQRALAAGNEKAALRSQRDAEAAAADARRRLFDGYVRDGWRSTAGGDPSVALLYFARAIEVAGGDSTAAEDARVCFGTLLATVPSLVDVPARTLVDPRYVSKSCRLHIDGKSVDVVELQTGKTLFSLGHSGMVHTAAFSPDGQWVLTASEDGTARVWQAGTGQPVTPPLRHGKAVYSAAFSPDGQRLVTASQDGTAMVWESASGHPLTPALKHRDVVWHAAFSPDGSRVVTCGEDGTARVWDATDGRQILELPHDHSSVLIAEFSPDGARVVTGSRDKTARLWDAADGRLVAALPHDGAVYCIGFSPDGRRLVTGSQDRCARVWSVDTGRALSPRLRQVDEVGSVEFLQGGGWVGAGPVNHMNRVWDVGRAGPPVPAIRHQANILSVAFSRDGRWIVTGSDDKTARVWDAAGGGPRTPPLGHKGVVRAAAFSPDGRLVVTGSDDGTARIWDAVSGAAVTPPLRHGGAVYSAAFSSDGRRVVTASDDKTARIWDAADGRELQKLSHSARVWAAAFSPDGGRVATGGEDPIARVWDANSGRAVAVLKRGNRMDRISSIAFSPDGSRVVTAGRDAKAGIWDAATGAEVAPPLLHRGAVRTASFSPDGRRILTGSYDGTARVWDAATGQPVTPFLRHGAAVRAATFSPDGRRVLTASDDESARVWDAAGGLPLTPPLRHEGAVWAAAFGPDGRHVVTAGKDNVARVWDVVPDARPAADLRALAELLASQRLDAADGLESLNEQQWQSTWDRLRQAYPHDFRPAPAVQPPGSF